MMKIVILALMAVSAMAHLPPFLGGLNLNNLPEGSMDMLKNLKPEDIKKALGNMPPEMMEMMKGMGVTKDQLKDAVENMPKDFDISAIMGNMRGQMKEESIADFKNQMEGMGFDLSDGASGLKAQILPKITDMLSKDLRYHGIDTDNTEELRRNAHLEIRMLIGAGEDDTKEEIREKLMRKIKEEMGEEGIEFDQDKLKNGFKEQMKEMGFDVEDGLDMHSMKEMLTKAMLSGKLGNPQQMMQEFVAPPQMMQEFGAPPQMMQEFGAPPHMMDLNLDININL